MDLIKISDDDLGLEILPMSDTKIRKSIRIGLFNQTGNIAVIYSRTNNYHKLPGGGIEENETEEVSLERETLEEVGYNIKNIVKIITIEEIRTHEPVHQFSFCYKANTHGEQKPQNLQGYEITEGFDIKWLTGKEIIQILEAEYNSQPYSGKFMNLRDRVFLEKLVN